MLNQINNYVLITKNDRSWAVTKYGF